MENNTAEARCNILRCAVQGKGEPVVIGCDPKMGAVFVLLTIPFLLFYDRTVLPLCNRCLPRQECTCMPTATAL